MDPNETLRRLLVALLARHTDEAAEHFANLAEWLDRDGYVPVAALDRAIQALSDYRESITPR